MVKVYYPKRGVYINYPIININEKKGKKIKDKDIMDSQVHQ